ncbi:MAG: hypothetical protein IJG45_02255 [Oscillospiraceae bacterium]|nr:hypothetical protein [Oscillospiraceae bacterium]
MKKLFALLLCCAMLACLFTACIDDVSDLDAAKDGASVATPSDAATEASSASDATDASEEHEHEHVNYKGLDDGAITLEDVIAAESREPDFSFEVGEETYYAYNDVTLGDLTFMQVQVSFREAGARISCKCRYADDPADVMDQIREAMTAQFGEPAASGDSYTWLDGHTPNRARLSVLNEDTVELVFELNKGE